MPKILLLKRKKIFFVKARTSELISGDFTDPEDEEDEEGEEDIDDEEGEDEGEGEREEEGEGETFKEEDE
jgi:hypothetical protein